MFSMALGSNPIVVVCTQKKKIKINLYMKMNAMRKQRFKTTANRRYMMKHEA